MTNPLDSIDPIDPGESESGTDDPAGRGDRRFSLLVVGLVVVAALLLGAALGYGIGRSQNEPPLQVVVTATPGQTGTQADGGSTQPTQQPAAGQPTPTIMDFVLSDARHFQGSPEAPITMVEFSDFK